MSGRLSALVMFLAIQSRAASYKGPEGYGNIHVTYKVAPASPIPGLPRAAISAAATAGGQNDARKPHTVAEVSQAAAQLVAPITEASSTGASDEALSGLGRDLADMRSPGGAVTNQASLAERVASEQPFIKKYFEQVRRVIVGQGPAVDLSIISLLVDGGHLLLEGMPGLGKTKLVETISRVSGLSNIRIQFRTDMLPSDIVGFKDKGENGEWKMRWGPITKAHIIQGDEINRGTPRAKSALLQPMQEGRVSVDDETKDLPQPYRVHATMNPIDTGGVFEMLEPEKDRFLISAFIDYPTKEEEKRIAREQRLKQKVVPEQVFSVDHINRLQALIEEIPIGDAMEDYIQDIVRATRPPVNKDSEISPYMDLKGYVILGASPRASIDMSKVAAAYAFLDGRSYVNADDVQKAALPVLRHRIKLSSKATVNRVRSEDLIAEILRNVPIPK